jgi:cell division protease FtsH
MGPLTYSEEEGEVFLGKSVARHKQVSDVTAHAIDEEIRLVIDSNYQRSEKILTDNMEKLHLMAEALIKYETIDADQIDDIMKGNTPRPPKGWEDIGSDSGSKDKPATDDAGAKGKESGADGKIGGPLSQH